MAEQAPITVFVTEQSEACTRVKRLLTQRGLEYTMVIVDTPEALDQLAKRTGRMTCPIVIVGDQVLGGLRETLDADKSGRLAEMVGQAS